MLSPGQGNDGARVWRVVMGVAFGCAATGVFRAIDQLLPNLQGGLWRPAHALNALIGTALNWSDSVISGSPVGVWCQETLLFLAVMISSLWLTRQQPLESLRFVGTITMVVAPWLTNAEGIIIRMATENPTLVAIRPRQWPSRSPR